MSQIRCIYTKDPGFPATDQHPDAIRYPFSHPVVGSLLVDALGGAPVQSEIDAVLFLVVDLSDFQNWTKIFRAKCLSDLAFRLGKAPGALTLADINAERTRIKNIADVL